jgi:predicted NAD/FAD-dependent oxidoreductase
LIRGRIENVSQESLSDFCQRHGVSSSMKHEILIPLMAAVCTVGIEESRQMPVGEVLEYITSTFLSSHYTTLPSFGVRGIVRRLIAPVKVENIVLNSNIYQIRFNDETSELRAYTLKYKVDHDNGEEEEQGEELDVDYIIFATQANQAATLLQTINNDTTSLNKTISALNSFKYVQALVVNHTDQSFLPLNPLDRRDLNLVAFDGSKKNKQDELSEGIWITHLPSTSVETTHLVSTSSSSSIVLQTTNPLRPIDPTKILSSSWFSRAFVTKESKKVLPKFFLGERRQRRREGEVEVENLQGLLLGSEEKEENGRRRSGGIYFTGSWCERGIPLLEGCVTSAEGVVRELLEREEGGTRRTKKDWPF